MKRLLIIPVIVLLVCVPIDISLYVAPQVVASSVHHDLSSSIGLRSCQADEPWEMMSSNIVAPEGEILLPPAAGQSISLLQRGWICTLWCLSGDTSLPEAVRTRRRIFGVDPAALNGFDSLDIMLPPISPGAEFEAYFPDVFAGRLQQDVRRPSSENIEWTIETMGTAGSMSWHPDVLPAGEFELSGSQHGVVDMKDVSGVPFAENAVLAVLAQSCVGAKGDVNADGVINVLDVVRVVNIILQIQSPPTDDELWAADCYGDGWVNILDTLAIVNVILGVGECRP